MAERLSAVVRRNDEWARESQRPAQRSGQDSETDDAERCQALQHLGRERAAQHLCLQRETVYQQRRVQGVERGDSEVREAARRVEADLCLAALDVVDGLLFTVELRAAPVRLDLDSQRAVRALGDLVGI